MLVALLPQHHRSQRKEELNSIQEPFILKLSFTTILSVNYQALSGVLDRGSETIIFFKC